MKKLTNLEIIQKNRAQKKKTLQGKLFKEKKSKKPFVKRKRIVNKDRYEVKEKKKSLDIWDTKGTIKSEKKKKKETQHKYKKHNQLFKKLHPKVHNSQKEKANKLQREKTNFSLRAVHPAQSYNPSKEDLFHAYVTARDKTENNEKRVEEKKEESEKPNEEEYHENNMGTGDDVLDGHLATVGKFEDLFPMKKEDSAFDKEKIIGRKKIKNFYGKVMKKRGRVKSKTLKNKTVGKKKKKKKVNIKQFERDLNKMVEDADERITHEAAVRSMKSKKRKRDEEEEENERFIAIQSLKDIEMNSKRTILGLSSKRIFDELTTVHTITTNKPPRKKRKMFSNK